MRQIRKAWSLVMIGALLLRTVWLAAMRRQVSAEELAMWTRWIVGGDGLSDAERVEVARRVLAAEVAS